MDLNELFFEAGFLPGPTTPIIASTTKVQSWVKPTTETEDEIKEAQEKYLATIADMRMEDGFTIHS